MRRAIPSAAVRAVSVQTGEARDSTASREGDFILSPLPPGEYSIVVSASGFDSASETVAITAGGRVRQHFILQPEGSPTRSAAREMTNQIQTLGRVVTASEL